MEGVIQQFLAAAGGVKTLAAGAVFALLFIGERIVSAAPPPHSTARLVRNLGLWAIVLLTSPLIVAPITAFGANHLLWERPEALHGGLILIADIVILDLWTYWVHRAWHRVPVMWRFHKVHHFDEFLDTTSAFRFHLGEVIVSAALRLIPITALAMPLAHVLTFETVFICAVLFHHSNLRLPSAFERALSKIMVTPSIHWVHHHAVMRDTHSNYAAIFSLWDRLFASKSATPRTPEMKIGLESVEDKPLLRLILTPFMRKT
ncbi:sterol desaturase family protein [Hyphococcus luteus]|uniref:Sterol desaturase family protein n=1 Tax=Hyphococcus luteus TaxID=2058213 RepID=A0A2S7JYS7_9PROT|nr:sterol desaturase family protein [Marinicaulis flavus]PQA85407.1 sterol desaturase family protein [Marinicaulis flavus]